MVAPRDQHVLVAGLIGREIVDYDDETTTLYYDGTDLVFRAGRFDEDLVEDLKHWIPAWDREWDGEYWRIAPHYGETLVDLIEIHLGEHLLLPEIPEEDLWEPDPF